MRIANILSLGSMIPYNRPTVVLNSAQMMINGNATKIIWRSHLDYSDRRRGEGVDVYEFMGVSILKEVGSS